jgi:hypothetical protein
MTYLKGTYPTPWPWVLSSIFLSILLGLLSLFTSYKTYHLSPSHEKQNKAIQSLAVAGVAITTLRSFASLILTARVVHNTSGRLAAPSSLIMLLTSIGISLVNLSLPALATYFVGVDFILVVTSLLMGLFAPPTVHGGHGIETYGTLNITGGNCIIPGHVDSCVSSLLSDIALYPALYTTGCVPGEVNTYETYYNNPLRVGEIALIVIGIIYAGYVAGNTVNVCRIFILPMEVYQFLALSRENFVGWKTEKNVNRQSRTEVDGRKVMLVQMVGVGVAFIICCVAIPLHITTARSTKAVVMYRDQSLEWRGNDSWYDCFPLHPPTDNLGFFQFWWAERTGQVEHILALV